MTSQRPAGGELPYAIVPLRPGDVERLGRAMLHQEGRDRLIAGGPDGAFVDDARVVDGRPNVDHGPRSLSLRRPRAYRRKFRGVDPTAASIGFALAKTLS